MFVTFFFLLVFPLRDISSFSVSTSQVKSMQASLAVPYMALGEDEYDQEREQNVTTVKRKKDVLRYTLS